MQVPYHYSSDLLPLLLSAAIALLLAVSAWRQRAVAGAAPFVVLQALVVCSSIANALQIASDNLAQMAFWLQVWAIFLFPMPVASLAFASEYAGVTRRLPRLVWALLLSVPIAVEVLSVTNDAHHLIWARIWLDQGLQFERGIVGDAYIGYAYALRFVALLIFASFFFRARGVYRTQTGLLIVGGLIGWGGMALRLVGVNVAWDIEPLVWGTMLCNLIFAWALFHYRAFDVKPIVRDMVIEHMGDGVIVLDMQDRVLDINPAARALLGIQTWPLGQTARQVLGEWKELRQQAGEMPVSDESYILKKTGKRYHTRALPLTDSTGAAIGQLILLQDMTELRRAEADLLQQARTLAIMEERERLARELHDSLGQVLGFVKMQAEAARTVLAQDRHQEADAYLEKLVTVAQDAHADVRDYIISVQTDDLLGRDFVATVREYVGRVNEIHHIPTTLTVSPGLDERVLEPMLLVQLLRIVQEALTNIRKHACAQSAAVSLVAQGSVLQVTVEDDGVGFDPAHAHSQTGTGYGLSAMRDRVRGIGGSVEFDSAPGKGTRVRVRVPLK